MILSAVVVIPVLGLFLLAFILIRTLSHLRPIESFEAAELLAVDAEGVCRRLAAAIRCKTVSQPDDASPAPKTLLELHRQLEEDFPLLHTRLIKETINTSSLLFTWKGTQPDLEPALLAAHLDVVPVDPAGLTAWDSPPFAGRVADGFVWGRGALDNKSQVIAILEAVETLLKAGFQPERTMYIAFGHDEETGGEHGACQIVAFLKERSIRLAAVLDEGGAVIQGALPGVELPVALVGTAEKGYLTLELTVNAQAGSSAIPPAQTAIGILARGLARLEVNPMPPRLTYLRSLFKALGAAAPFLLQAAVANIWLTGGLLTRLLSGKPQTAAIIRTTSAITVISGGIKDNMLPSQARATVNFRLLPGDTIAKVCTHVRQLLADDRIHFTARPGAAWEASPLSGAGAPAFKSIALAIRQVFGGVPVAPYLVFGATDARHYAQVCDQVYRFTPLQLDTQDLDRIHGVNERISPANLVAMVQFYGLLLQSWSSGQTGV